MTRTRTWRNLRDPRSKEAPVAGVEEELIAAACVATSQDASETALADVDGVDIECPVGTFSLAYLPAGDCCLLLSACFVVAIAPAARCKQLAVSSFRTNPSQ